MLRPYSRAYSTGTDSTKPGLHGPSSPAGLPEWRRTAQVSIATDTAALYA
jgi:hypothetical protein